MVGYTYSLRKWGGYGAGSDVHESKYLGVDWAEYGIDVTLGLLAFRGQPDFHLNLIEAEVSRPATWL
jgi:hypothetical protein